MTKKPPAIFTVTKAWHLTPHMIRVTLTAPEVAQMSPNCHGANCKLFLPEPGQSHDDFAHKLSDGPRPVVRTYTVRQMRQKLCEIDIDFVDHGDSGPASAWARRAVPGAFCGFAGPGPVKVKDFYADNYLVVADMSALPVASATLEAMPDNAKGTAILEILAPEDRQNIRMPKGIDCIWIVNPDPYHPADNIAERVRALPQPHGVIQTCIAGESSTIKALRQELLVKRQLPKDDCYISGYWKIGLIEDEHQQMKRAEAG